MSAPTGHWLGDHESKPAPEPLNRIQALVNTLELPTGPDRLADPDVARPWLIDHRLLAPDADVSEADLDLLRGVRAALRALLVHNAGGPPPDDAALAPLRTVAARGTARVHFDAVGAVQVAPIGDSVPERLVDLLLVVRDAQRDGSWGRLKACGNDECLWAFYDKSRNQGGTWCDMATCGNKLKNREFRARRRGGT